eukprot:IDg17673t1
MPESAEAAEEAEAWDVPATGGDGDAEKKPMLSALVDNTTDESCVAPDARATETESCRTILARARAVERARRLAEFEGSKDALLHHALKRVQQ